MPGLSDVWQDVLQIKFGHPCDLLRLIAGHLPDEEYVEGTAESPSGLEGKGSGTARDFSVPTTFLARQKV
jgi:hypothetical protein